MTLYKSLFKLVWVNGVFIIIIIIILLALQPTVSFSLPPHLQFF